MTIDWGCFHLNVNNINHFIQINKKFLIFMANIHNKLCAGKLSMMMNGQQFKKAHAIAKKSVAKSEHKINKE